MGNIVERKITPSNPRIVEKQQYTLYAPTARTVNEKGMTTYDPTDFIINNGQLKMRYSAKVLNDALTEIQQWKDSLIKDDVDIGSPAASEHVWSAQHTSDMIEEAKLSGIHFVGYISTTMIDPVTSLFLKEGDWLHISSVVGQPEVGPWPASTMFTFTNGAWVIWTQDYIPVNFQTWENTNITQPQPSGFYWFGDHWQALDFYFDASMYAMWEETGFVSEINSDLATLVENTGLDLTIVNALNYTYAMAENNETEITKVSQELGDITMLMSPLKNSAVDGINSSWLELQNKMASLIKTIDPVVNTNWNWVFNGSTNTFVVPNGVDPTGYFMVFINGVARVFTVAGQNVTLDVTPVAGDIARVTYIDKSILWLPG